VDNRRSDSQLTDAMLEREIERALAVDPSPEFLARVRSGIASEPAAPAWRFSWTLLAAASAVVVVIAAVVTLRQLEVERGRLRESAPIAARPIGAAFVSLAPVGPSRVLDVSPQRFPPARPGVLRTTSTEPEVLIARDESAALRRLMRGMPRGVVVDSPAPGDGLNGIEAMQPLKVIAFESVAEISPITIEPLGSVAREEGGRR
jgi:hypothetical protein